MLDLDLSLGVLVDGERVDHADGVALTQALELGDDLAAEVRVLESEHDELNWSDCHFGSLLFGTAILGHAGRGGIIPIR